MPQSRTTCPRCHQPVVVDVTQLFDVNADPQAKQRFLSGDFNIIHCPSCGYEGSMATPLVYHDPSKELLLTYFPPELGLPVNEQERLVGPLINQVMSKLPTEQRKAYLLRPQSMFTLQTMIERVLEADGITHEMIEAQQQRLNLLQRLMSATPDSRVEIAKQETNLLDESFFALISRLAETALSSGDEQSAQGLAELQAQLMPLSEAGRRLQADAQETEAAIQSLQEASKKGLTREMLLDLIAEAPTDTRLNTLVSMTRPGLDYSFFQILSERIDKANGAERERLLALRARLLELTTQIDKEIQAQTEQLKQLLEKLLATPDIEKATEQVLPAVNEMFVNILREELDAARQKGDLERSAKLQKVVGVIQQASTPPPEYQLLEDLLGAKDDGALRELFQKNAEKITPEFLQLLAGVIGQTEQQGQEPELLKQLQAIHRAALRFSMEANLKK